MTEPTPAPALRPAPRRWGWWLAGGLAVSAILAGGGIWAERQSLGASVLEAWLRDQGVQGEVAFTTFGPDGLSGALRIGRRGGPGLTVDVADVAYRLHGPWEGRPLGADLKSVRLLRPVLQGEWRNGALRFGDLDPLIRKVLSQPQDPARKLPDVVIEGGRLVLTTPAGAFEGSGSGALAAGHLVRMDVSLEPTEARTSALQTRLRAAELHVVRRNDRLMWAGDLHAETLKTGGLSAQGVDLRLTGETPYPDLKTRRADGKANLVLTSAIRSLRGSGVSVQGLSQTTRFEGDLLGETASGRLHTGLSTGPVRAGKTLTLTRLSGAMSGPARLTSSGLVMTLSGGADSAGRIGGRRFVAKAPGQTLKVRLTDALLVEGRGPMEVAAGAVRARLDLDRYRLDARGLAAHGRLSARGSVGPVQDGAVDLKAGLVASGGLVRVLAEGCAPIRAARLDPGANPVTGLAGEICPSRLEAGPSGMRFEGGFRKIALQSGALEAAITDGEGQIRARGPDLTFDATITRAKLTDLATARRFQPVFATGSVSGSIRDLKGDFRVTDAYARGLADIQLRQTGGSGGLTVDTGPLVFAEGGLQPRDVSPLAAALGAPVSGQAQFRGGVDWSGKTLSSHGQVDVASLDFIGGAGPVRGLTGKVAFSSLLPLKAAPGQTLHVARMESLAALTDADVTFGLGDKALNVSAAAFSMAQGRVVLQPFDIPLAANEPLSVVAELKGVQLSDLVEASPFADRMDLTARVDGHIPMSFRKGTVQVAGGEFHAIEPGRLSIRREALTLVKAAGGPAKPKASVVDPFSDFAFQALENLAFTELDARVDSLPEGRLGVRFHIKGEHSPKVSPEIRLTLRELLTQKINRTLPLPKGVKVDLSLETSVNLDQLIDDFDKYQTLRGSAAVQP